MGPYWLFYLTKLSSKGLATATDVKGQSHFGSREKRAIPVMVILQAGAAIGGTLIKGINVDVHLTIHLKWLQQM